LITEPWPDAFSASPQAFIPRNTPVWSIDRALPIRERRLLDRREVAEPGVVDEDVEVPVVGEHALDDGVPALLVGHVQVEEGCLAALAADRAGGLLACLVLHVGHDRDRALAGEAFRRGEADPARGARDERHSPLETLHCLSFPARTTRHPR